jgi:hypothetical protein
MPIKLDHSPRPKMQALNRLVNRRVRLAKAHTCHRAKQAKVFAESSRKGLSQSLADLPAVLRSEWNFDFDFSDEEI